jgi:DNA polymerase (family 10)
MSDGAKYPYDFAINIANQLVAELKPHCERIEIAGSLRRKKKEVGDIELVLIPKPYEIGLFCSGIAMVLGQYKNVKGQLNYGACKYTQRIHTSGMKIDIFMPTKNNWGNILAIRTGSDGFSFGVLAYGWKKAGFTSVDGYLTKDGMQYFAPEEEDFFRLCGVAWRPPEQREVERKP